MYISDGVDGPTGMDHDMAATFVRGGNDGERPQRRHDDSSTVGYVSFDTRIEYRGHFHEYCASSMATTTTTTNTTRRDGQL